VIGEVNLRCLAAQVVGALGRKLASIASQDTHPRAEAAPGVGWSSLPDVTAHQWLRRDRSQRPDAPLQFSNAQNILLYYNVLKEFLGEIKFGRVRKGRKFVCALHSLLVASEQHLGELI
jgi:hypothetical protein